MAAVMSRPGQERSLSFSRSRRMQKGPLVRSPKSVLLPESPDSSTESSSLPSSITGEQNVECASFGSLKKKDKTKAISEARFEQVDDYTWFMSIDQPSDLLVEVEEISFYLHKVLFLSRSGLMFRLASQSCDSQKAYINLVDVPGGAESFMQLIKFCYGIVEGLTPTNVATILCVGEYLEMTEAFEEGNVVSKAEAYLNNVILNSWQESIIVLQSCELLLPWAADMNLVKRCAESVAEKACTDPNGVSWHYSGTEMSSSMSTVPTVTLEGSVVKVVPQDWWYEDLSHLTIYCFSEVVEAIKKKGMHPDLLGGALEYYAQRWLPGLVKVDQKTQSGKGTSMCSASLASTRRNSPASSPRKGGIQYNCSTKGIGEDGQAKLHESIAEQNRNRFILEEIVSMLPTKKDAVSCGFLLRMTRAAFILNCDIECKADLERRAGLQLDQGSLSDLLIPSFSHTSEYLYDIDIVRRILDHFLANELNDKSISGSPKSWSGENRSTRNIHDGLAAKKPQPSLNLRAKVAKLIDSYLAEVARDSKLPFAKFQLLADALPEGSRLCDDGLYRAVDTYLKIHPTMTEQERKRLCRILNCHRLSLDACTHASQNERLPLRFVVQVLFCEQLKIRSTVTEVSNSVKEDRASADNISVASRGPTGADSQPTASTSAALQENVNQMEIRALQRELATMRVKCIDLEKDQSTVQDRVEQISRMSRGRSSSWSSGAWKKFSKLQLFNPKDHKDGGDSTRTDESRPGNPRRWRNSIS